MKSVGSFSFIRDLNLAFARGGKATTYGIIGLAGGLCVATAALVWFGYIATREWRYGSEALLERRQAEAAALVGSVLDRDMKGASASLLIPMNHLTLAEEPPFDLVQLAARTFARFPYPESLLIWRDLDHVSEMYAFNRADRRPAWDDSPEAEDPFPILSKKNPAALVPLVQTIRDRHNPSRSFAVISTTVAGVPYQVIVHYLMGPTPSYRLSAFAALMVNMDWVRTEYFGPVLQQTATIGGNIDILSFSVIDNNANIVAAIGHPQPDSRDSQRGFPLLFLDRVLLSATGGQLEPIQEWTIHIRASSDSTYSSALQGARRTFLLIALSAIVTIAALLMTLRAVEARAALATMKSDFVSAVTHDLKTPVALIRLVGDTLAGGRYTSPSAVADYARLLSQESARLSQSINQLLTYARYSDAQRKESLTFSLLDVPPLIDHGLETLRPALTAAKFEVETDFAANLPPVEGDASALTRVVENLIDNAVKYGTGSPFLRISACPDGKFVKIVFLDRGIGIPEDELRHVFDRFYRARNATASGTGLGLTIAKRIVQWHGGRINVKSTVGVGTQVELMLPIGTGS
jgi:signal transduction histidine kinase